MNQISPESDNDDNFQVIFAGIALKLKKKKKWQNAFKFQSMSNFFPCHQ